MFRMNRVIAGVLLACSSLPVSAALVTVDGDNVRFTYDDSTLYGTGTVVGDNIFFSPDDFRAESLNGEGAINVADTLDIQVEIITAGFWLEEFAVVEQGDYYLDGVGASAEMNGMLTVTSNTIVNSDSTNFDAGPLTVQGATTEWNASASLDLSWGTDTDVDLELMNSSTATTTNPGEQAWVQKKLGVVGVQITAVPVPAAVWMFGSGLIALFGWARRRQAAV